MAARQRRKALEADYQAFSQRLPELTSLKATGETINLVSDGAMLHQVYCSICHSLQPEGETGKAGPSWHGLIGKSTRQRKVLVKPAGIQSITIDDKYIEESILQPNLHLAIRETGPQMDSPYPPGMPPYPHLTPQQVRSLIAFMKTLNEPGNRGPQEVWEVKQAEPQLPMDRFEVVVKDRPLVYRVAMADVSTRALSVGLPGGFNYIFDPSTFSVKRAWAGGFLNLKAERTGRGAGYNQYGALQPRHRVRRMLDSLGRKRTDQPGLQGLYQQSGMANRDIKVRDERDDRVHRPQAARRRAVRRIPIRGCTGTDLPVSDQWC